MATSLNVVTDSSAVTVRKAGSAAGTANVSARMTANSAGSRISNPTAGLTVNPTVTTNHVKVVATARVSATAGRTNGLLPTSVVSAVKARHGLHGTNLRSATAPEVTVATAVSPTTADVQCRMTSVPGVQVPVSHLHPGAGIIPMRVRSHLKTPWHCVATRMH